MFSFDLQRFGGKGGYQSSGPIIAELSPEQKRTIELQNKYLESTGPVLSDLVSKGSSALQAYQAPNFNQYANQGMGITQEAVAGNRALAQGNLPSAYNAGMDAAISEALTPYQQQFSNLGSRGVINSSIGKQWATEASKAAQTAANLAYNQNLTTASQLNAAYGQSATAPLNYQQALYGAQTQPAKDFLTLGTQTYQPTGQAANQAYQWQAAMSAPAQNQYVQQPGFGSVFGSVLGGLAGNPGLFRR